MKSGEKMYDKTHVHNEIGTQSINLKEEINAVRKNLISANARFNMQTDFDLVEATIYEIKSLNARYRYLIREAKRRQAGEK